MESSPSCRQAGIEVPGLPSRMRAKTSPGVTRQRQSTLVKSWGGPESACWRTPWPSARSPWQSAQ